MANVNALTSHMGTGKNMTGFVFGPNTRGTIDIFYGCLIVLITAIWTVSHINIPARNDSFWRVLFRRLRWGCVSIFAPDFLTLVAATQWDSASKSVVQMRALHQVKDDPEKWCLEHAFYANSGGFLLHTPDSRPFPINAASTHYLVSKGYIPLPEITVAEIWDKSKADVFAKAVAILQGVWFIAQSIARFVQGLPLSPFELFTLAFVVSTSMSYFFWWRKPQSVSTPTVLLCSCSVATIRSEAGLLEGGWERTPMDFVEREGQTWMRRKAFRSFDLEVGPRSPTEQRKFVKTSSKSDALSASTQQSPNTSLSPSPAESGEDSKSIFSENNRYGTVTLAGEATSPASFSTSTPGTLSPLNNGPGPDMSIDVGIDVDLSSEPSGTTIVTNVEQSASVQRIPDDAQMPARLPLKILAGVTIPATIHSGIHLLGWNLDYPSHIEKQLWRVSAVTLVGMMCISVGTVRLLAITGYKGRYSLVFVWVNTNAEPTAKKNRRQCESQREGKEAESSKSKTNSRLARCGQAIMAYGERLWGDIAFNIWEVFLLFASVALILARCYIIVEVIISFRALPEDVFLTVSWLNFLPHV